MNDINRLASIAHRAGGPSGRGPAAAVRGLSPDHRRRGDEAGSGSPPSSATLRPRPAPWTSTPSSPTAHALVACRHDDPRLGPLSLADAATARRSISSSGRSPSSTASVPKGIPGSSRFASIARTAPATTRGAGARAKPPVVGVTDFYRVEGEEIHEVAVGPVHAGVIEPGHFRFQCHGEQVFHLEISLGYQHRGVERALVGGPDKRTIHLMETGGRRHLGRPRHGLLPGGRGAGRLSSRRSGRRRFAASPSSWNGWPTTPATWAPWPATSGSCRPPPTAGASAATSST